MQMFYPGAKKQKGKKGGGHTFWCDGARVCTHLQMCVTRVVLCEVRVLVFSNQCKQARALLTMPLRVNAQNNFQLQICFSGKSEFNTSPISPRDKCWSALYLSAVVESLAAATNSLSNIVKCNEMHHIVYVYPTKCISITWHFEGKNTYMSISTVGLRGQGTTVDMERILPFPTL